VTSLLDLALPGSALATLGQSYESDAIQRIVRSWPQLEWIDEEELQGAERDNRLSLMNRELGLYLFFANEQGFRDRYGPPTSSGKLILSRIVFVLDPLSTFAPYVSVLPLEVGRTDNYESLTRKFGTPLKVVSTSGRVHKARWPVESAELEVSFNPDSRAPKLVSLAPVRSPAALRDDASRAAQCAELPTPGRLVSLMGAPLSQLMRESALATLELHQCQSEIADYGEADFTRELGLELYFKHGKDIDRSVQPGGPSSEPCLSGVRYRADLDFNCPGFAGVLPLGLSFDDTPEVVAAKVGEPPFWSSPNDDTDAAQRWHLPRADLHVLYSTLENRIYRVTLLARGSYEG
jgi:hypothetical protein